MENNIAVRLEQFIKYKKLTIKSFCGNCGFKTMAFYNWKNGVNNFTKKTTDRIIKAYPEINEQWLYSGSGSMLNDENIIVNEPVDEYNSCKKCKEKDIQIKIYSDYINTLKEKLNECNKQLEKRKVG